MSAERNSEPGRLGEGAPQFCPRSGPVLFRRHTEHSGNPPGNVSGGGILWRPKVPIPKHVRITWRGSILGTPETWTTGAHFDAAAGGNPDGHAADVDLQACADGWGA